MSRNIHINRRSGQWTPTRIQTEPEPFSSSFSEFSDSGIGKYVTASEDCATVDPEIQGMVCINASWLELQDTESGSDEFYSGLASGEFALEEGTGFPSPSNMLANTTTILLSLTLEMDNSMNLGYHSNTADLAPSFTPPLDTFDTSCPYSGGSPHSQNSIVRAATFTSSIERFFLSESVNSTLTSKEGITAQLRNRDYPTTFTFDGPTFPTPMAESWEYRIAPLPFQKEVCGHSQCQISPKLGLSRKKSWFYENIGDKETSPDSESRWSFEERITISMLNALQLKIKQPAPLERRRSARSSAARLLLAASEKVVRAVNLRGKNTKPVNF